MRVLHYLFNLQRGRCDMLWQGQTLSFDFLSCPVRGLGRYMKHLSNISTTL
jgi:hypothetical protein